MKKVLLIVAMLLAVSPVMAGVTVTAVNEGTYNTTGPGDANRSATLRIGYTYTSDANVRAFALDINIDNGNFWNIRDFNVGENNSTIQGYGIFPGNFRAVINPIDANGPNWAKSGYTPLTPWNDPGTTNTGIGFGEIIAELGYLGAGEANRPANSGTLFRVDVNVYQFTGTAHVTIVPDAMRGGIVNKDTGATIAWAGSETDVCFPCVPVTIPTIVGLDTNDANTALANAGFSVGTIGYECNNTYAAGLVCAQDTGSECTNVPVNYWVSTGPCCTTPANEVGVATATAEGVWTGQGFTIGTKTQVVDCAHLGLVISYNPTICTALPAAINYSYGVAPTEPNVVGLTRAAAVTALTNAGFTIQLPDVNGFGTASIKTVGTVYAQNPVAGTQACGQAVTLSVVSYPIKATSSFYANWVTNGKPQCWAYPRQCHGDADGKKQLSYWVGTNDLAIYKVAVNKAATLIPPGGHCADFDHQKQLSYWVGTNDLAIYKAYVNKAESLVPICGSTATTGDPNFWYWCLPSGGTCPTSPAGQVCATVGTCPNTP